MPFRCAVLPYFVVALLTTCAAAAGQITVYTGGNLAIGETKQLTAYVPLTPNTVMWSVNGITGGNSTYGTVSSTGLYAAPLTVPMNNAVEVRATSTAYPTSSDHHDHHHAPAAQLWRRLADLGGCR